jgi:orotate phosphoribosyltransferase
MNNEIIEYLFSTEAIRVSDSQEMFLFTSGLISPYYVSTHFLCGGENASTSMLELIDSYKLQPEKIVFEVAPKIIELSRKDKVYSKVISLMKSHALEYIRNNKVSFISGGERRDWFFSIPLAKELGLPHLFLFNDKKILDENGVDFKFQADEMLNSIHVADLLTVGSSYTTKWIPALNNKNIKISLSLNCVDRAQNGVSNLKKEGVGDVISLCRIDNNFFEYAYSSNVINIEQKNNLKNYFTEQFDSMRNFLISNPNFILNKLNSDQKTRARIKLTLENDLYKLGDKFISQFDYLN